MLRSTIVDQNSQDNRLNEILKLTRDVHKALFKSSENVNQGTDQEKANDFEANMIFKTIRKLSK